MPAKIAMLPTRKIFLPYVSLSLPHSPLTSISATEAAPKPTPVIFEDVAAAPKPTPALRGPRVAIFEDAAAEAAPRGRVAFAEEVSFEEKRARVGCGGPVQAPKTCLLYTSPSPRDYAASRMPSSA